MTVISSNPNKSKIRVVPLTLFSRSSRPRQPQGWTTTPPRRPSIRILPPFPTNKPFQLNPIKLESYNKFYQISRSPIRLSLSPFADILSALCATTSSLSPPHRPTSAALLWSCTPSRPVTRSRFATSSVLSHLLGDNTSSKKLKKLLSIGAISPADPGACPYASRTVITPKKDGSMRMCVDYSEINSQTEKDLFPLPRIDQVWPTLSRARYFASLDLLMGFHQVEVDPGDRAKTAFLTYRGLNIHNVMPFSLCNAAATFQRLMERVLGTLIGRGVLVYIDTFSSTQRLQSNS